MTTQEDPQFVSIKPSFVTFDAEGEFVQGYFIALDYIDMRTGAVPKYTLQSGNGPVSFLGTVQLVEAISRVPMGTLIKVIYTGDRKTQAGFKVKDFDVQVALEEGGRMPTLDASLDKAFANGQQGSLLATMPREPTGYDEEAATRVLEAAIAEVETPPGERGKPAAAAAKAT